MRRLPELILFAGLLAFISGCLASGPVHVDSVAVHGTDEFQQQVTGALLLLKTKAPTAYVTVTNEIGIIPQAKRSGMKAWTRPPTFELSEGTAFYSLTWCAGSIAHDSFHSKL